MIKILKQLLLTVFVFYSFSLSAQVVYEKGIPYSLENEKNVKETKDIPVALMSELDYDKLLKEDEKDIEIGLPPRFGFIHEVNYNLKNSGTWEKLPNGDRIWRLTIFAPKARTINLNYSQYDIPLGGKLFIYNKDRTDILGPFTTKNEKVNGEFATGFTKGQQCTIEYYEPRSVLGKSNLEIDGIIHGYKSIRSFADDFIKSFQDSGACNNDVQCALGAGWENQIKSVGLITTSGGGRFCTGALINTTADDCRPYFLSANHCFSSDNVGDVLNDIFIFNYESPTPACPGIPTTDGSTSESVQGATIIAKASNSDFCLMELSSNPLDAGYDVYYSGWDRTNNAPTSGCGIHHPSGDVKKISFENDPLSGNGSFGGSPTGTHWEVPDWDQGTTEPGSSGSPLFDQANKRIIGQLHGGGAACSGSGNNGLSDVYGKIWYSWDQNGTGTAGLADWLDPIGTGALVMDGNDCSTPMPPVAGFTPIDNSTYSFCAISDIQFNDATSGVPTSWSWTFSGAGVSPTTSTDQSPLVTVSSSGTLTATLVATNALGTDSHTQNYNVTVEACADFTPVDMTAYSFCTLGDIPFNATDYGIPTTYSWTFSGAGVSPTTSTTQSPNVSVSTTGTLTAILSVSNSVGTDTQTHTYDIVVEECSTYCDVPALAIPDDDATGISSTFTVPASGIIDDIDIEVDITHTYVGDLIITVEHNGTTVILADQPGVPASTYGCNENNVDVIFDDEATSAVEGVCNSNPAIGGSVIPEEALSAFDGMDQSGTWTITVSDNAGQDTGDLNEWCLTIVTAGATCHTMLDNTTLPATESGLADYESEDWIQSTSEIQNGASVDYDAVDYVQLDAGFVVEQGAVFQAFIDGCDNGGGGVNLSGNAPNNLKAKEELDLLKKSRKVIKETILKDIIKQMNQAIQTAKDKG